MRMPRCRRIRKSVKKALTKSDFLEVSYSFRLQEIEMAIPLLPFLLGAATGAALTYIISNRGARRRLTSAAEEMGDVVQARAEKIKSAASDTVDKATAAAKDAASKVSN